MSTLNATKLPPHFIPALALPFEPDPPPRRPAKRALPAKRSPQTIIAVTDRKEPEFRAQVARQH